MAYDDPWMYPSSSPTANPRKPWAGGVIPSPYPTPAPTTDIRGGDIGVGPLPPFHLPPEPFPGPSPLPGGTIPSPYPQPSPTANPRDEPMQGFPQLPNYPVPSNPYPHLQPTANPNPNQMVEQMVAWTPPQGPPGPPTPLDFYGPSEEHIPLRRLTRRRYW